ncbi:MAG TPA: hypothetical protein VMP67_07780 [Candidatus Limnocylindria bacterium]|nr:hypothetical protein [Candidatus Limnocylindria bacterium]
MSLPLADQAVHAGRPIRRRGRLASAGRSLALSVALAACGGAAPDAPGNPGTGGPVGPGGPTLRPVDGSLAALLPTQVGGETLTVESGDGTAGLALLPAADLASITEQLDGLNLTPERLSFAVAGDMATANDESGLALAAVRVPGVLYTPGSGPQLELVKSLLGSSGPARPARATFDGKSTTTIRQASDDGDVTTYIYSPTEVIFIARGTRELVEQAFDLIPARP